jgi:hypothetical protein
MLLECEEIPASLKIAMKKTTKRSSNSIDFAYVDSCLDKILSTCHYQTEVLHNTVSFARFELASWLENEERVVATETRFECWSTD